MTRIITHEFYEDLVSSLARHPVKILLFDYDGTLTPIVPRHEDAVLDTAVRDMLRRLSQVPGVHLGIITGRSLKSVKTLTGLEDILFVTNHGFLIEMDKYMVRFDNNFNTEENYAARYRIIMSYLSRYPGIETEQKEVTTAFHYRNVAEDLQEACREDIINLVTTYFGPKEIRIIEGKKVIEILPARSLSDELGGNVEIHKGVSIQYVIERIQQKLGVTDSFSLFIGDDTTDEFGFDYVNRLGKVSIKVGMEDTKAQYRLRDVPAVRDFLQRLISILTDGSAVKPERPAL